MIFNMTGGAPGGEAESTILVTAPAGSAVTASLNGVTKTAREGSGLWTFPGCGLGLWTVHAQSADQTQEAQVTVDIQEESQRMRYYVTITYFAATIQVAYPAGSVCTCANGDTVLSAPDTSGTAAFVLLQPGDWTVSCSNGLSGEEYREKSETVSITEDGQQETITIRYVLHILTNGVLADGYSIGGVFTQQSGFLQHSEGHNEQGIAHIIPMVSADGYTTMHISAYTQGTNQNAVIYVGLKKNTAVNTDFAASQKLPAIIGSKTTYQIDVASVTGECCVATYVYSNTSKTHILKVCDIWLE